MAFRIQSLLKSITRAGTLVNSAQGKPLFTRRTTYMIQPNIIRNRHYSSEGRGKNVRSRLGMGLCTIIAAAGVGGGYYLWTTQGGSWEAQNEAKLCPKYQRVYNAIAKSLNDDNYDDGSYGPILVRLAWHSSGTYDMKSNTGGSNKSTMRFEPESKYNANNGLHIARNKLEGIKKQFPWISYGDLWTLAGVCGVQEMGGPTIAWRPGRKDGVAADCPPDGRLPDGKQGTPQHPRDVFYRMGFNDQEIVALVGAHTLGRCHEDRSGFDGHWTMSPVSFSNSFFVDLLNRIWVERKWNGNQQFQDEETGELMMLPTDLTFLQDSEFRKWATIYAKDEQKFFEDFAKAYQKLLELGVPYPKGKQEYVFRTLDEQS